MNSTPFKRTIPPSDLIPMDIFVDCEPLEVDLVYANASHPDWLKEPNRMVSPSGSGAHPRGMAIDVCVLDINGLEVDMGAASDEMTPKSYRSCTDLPETVLQNRKLLEDSFTDSAKALGFSFLPLPEEWWDFRSPADLYGRYKPLSDKDLPQQMQMNRRTGNGIPDFEDTHFQSLANKITTLIDRHR